MDNILIIGGAGYIGSHMCKYLKRLNYIPVVLDNFIYGHKQAVKWGQFYEGSMADGGLLDLVFKEHDIKAVMHFAAFCYVGESVTEPAKYYANNVVNTHHLLEGMRRNGIGTIIFSSTCATYGEPTEIPITESHPQNPVNPYGRTKLMVEHMLKDYSNAYGFKYALLRYFNASGADPEGEIGEDHRPETHLIPLVIDAALGLRGKLMVFGDNYNTHDGTCIRDYIHINDLAAAHVLAMEKLFEDENACIFNLGNGKGYSVMEVIDSVSRITGKSVPFQITERRAGDPAVLVGSAEKAIRELKWKPEFNDLDAIVKTAYQWRINHPDGYAE